MDAGEDLDKGGLAGAVLAHEPVHLAPVELDVAVRKRMDGAEALLGVLQGDDGRWVRCRHDRRVKGGGRREARRPPDWPRT